MNPFFLHSKLRKNTVNRVTVCAVFVEELGLLVFSGVVKPVNGFCKRCARLGALSRTSGRPFITLNCSSLKQAKELTYSIGSVLLKALEADPSYCYTHKRAVERSSKKQVLENLNRLVSEEGTISETVEEAPKGVLKVMSIQRQEVKAHA
jgi:hypothetical protein